MSRASLLPDAPALPDLDQAIYLASRDYRGGQTALAYTVAVEPGTFQKKVSISNATHRLSLAEFMAVAEATDDQRIDQAYARQRGGLFFRPTPVPATNDALQALGKLLEAEGRFVSSLGYGVADNIWERHEVEDLERHGYAVIAKVLGIMAGARQAMEGEANG